MRITEDDFKNWWASPVGIEVRKLMSEDLNKIAHLTTNEQYARDPISMAVEIGKYEAIKFYFNLSFKDLMGE